MSSDQLPRDWPHRSLTDPALARAVLDHWVSAADRDEGGLAVVWCNADGRPRQPVLLDSLPRDPTVQERRAALAWAARACRPFEGHGDQRPCTLVVATVHPEEGVTDDDRAVHQLAIEVCAEHGIELLGAHVVTPTGVHTLPGASRAA